MAWRLRRLFDNDERTIVLRSLVNADAFRVFTKDDDQIFSSADLKT